MKVNICESCGKEYEGNFCPECGLKRGPVKRCPGCGAYVFGKYCSECGRLCDTASFAGDGASDVTIPSSGTRDYGGSRGLRYGDMLLGGYACTGLIDCDDLDIAISSAHNGKFVVSVGDKAFYKCTAITSVIIPPSVTSIGTYAFYECKSLKSVVIPGSVAKMGDYAFFGCNALKKVFYVGGKVDWPKISVGLYNNAFTPNRLHYYSEERPGEDGNFRHYVCGEPAVW